MKNIRKTQIDSYRQLQPSIGEKQAIVLGVIVRKEPITNREIANELSWEINRITGRVTELVDKGLVTAGGTKKDLNTNRTVTTWVLINSNK